MTSHTSTTEPVIHTRVWRNNTLESTDFPLANVSDYLQQPDCMVWADICTPDRATLDALAEELSLDPLAVKDAVSAHERAKLDRYSSHLFLTAYGVRLASPTGLLTTVRISAFILPNALITVRATSAFNMDKVVERWDSSPDLLANGVSALLYGLLDIIVDNHFDVVQTLDEQMDDIENLLFQEVSRPREVLQRTYRLRKDLVRLRRVVLPMREVVNSLLRRESPIIDDAMIPYFQDVYDHVLRASEWTESLRELVTTAFETHLSVQDSRLNQVVKKLTGWAAIIAVPTAVTGFYGQNIPYPGFGNQAGLWSSSIIIAVAVLAIYVSFKKRGWL